MDNKEKNRKIIQSLSLAMLTPEDSQENWRTDIIGIALQYCTRPKLKRKDYEPYLKLTLQELINLSVIPSKINKNESKT